MLVLPGVDERAVDRLLLREHVLKPFDQITAAFREYCGQDRRYVEDFRQLGEADDIIDDHRRLMAVQVGELVGLMVDQHEDAVFRAQQGAETGLGHGNSLGYAGGGSGGGGIDKDVERLDAIAFNPGDVGSGHNRGTVRRTGTPTQPSHTVMANSGTNRVEGEVWRQAR